MLSMICLLAIAVGLWLICFACGQVLMLLFPACPDEEVLLPHFAQISWKPVLTLAGLALVLAFFLFVPLLKYCMS